MSGEIEETLKEAQELTDKDSQVSSTKTNEEETKRNYSPLKYFSKRRTIGSVLFVLFSSIFLDLIIPLIPLIFLIGLFGSTFILGGLTKTTYPEIEIAGILGGIFLVFFGSLSIPFVFSIALCSLLSVLGLYLGRDARKGFEQDV